MLLGEIADIRPGLPVRSRIETEAMGRKSR